MLGGTFIQGGGLYLCAIFIPWILCRRQLGFHKNLANQFLKIGLGFILTFSMFPLTNLLGFFSAQTEPFAISLASKPLPIPKLLDSHFSSAVFGTGVMFILLSFFLRLNRSQKQQSSTVQEPLFLSFTIGTLTASCFLGVYLFFQHYTGFDYKAIGFKLEPAKQLVSSNSYRTLGFFSHPLSLAGGSLTIFTFFWSLCCMSLSKGKQNNKMSHADYLNKNYRWLYLCIAGLHLSFIILSGGRFAILLSICILTLSLLLTPLPRTFRYAKLGLMTLALSASAILTIHSGVLVRFQELKLLWQHDQLDRLKFWQVHWQMILDQPWIGHGYAWLKHYKRDLYYNHLGYEHLANKYNAHNLYLEILANSGILGMLGVLSGLSIIIISFKDLSKDTQQQALFSSLMIALFANLANGMTQNSLFDSNIIYIYLFMIWVLTWNLLLTSSKKLSYQNSPSDKHL